MEWDPGLSRSSHIHGPNVIIQPVFPGVCSNYLLQGIQNGRQRKAGGLGGNNKQHPKKIDAAHNIMQSDARM